MNTTHLSVRRRCLRFVGTLTSNAHSDCARDRLWSTRRDQGATKEPEFLTKMLSDPDWRQAFINLADKHKSCPVLSYCIKRISEVSAADVFQVARFESHMLSARLVWRHANSHA